MKTISLKKVVLSLCIGFLLTYTAKANNLNITNVAVAAGNVTFDITWDNSWNASGAPSNWDAIWIFVKYNDCATTNWLHADLSTTSGDHSIGGGVLQVDAVTDGKGVFIRRSAAGSGNIASSSASLKLNIAAGTYDFKVFGVEMVKIVNEDFEVGDNGATWRFNSVSITSENAVTAAVLGGSGTVDLPAAYPKGWDAFYSMKYEISQEQYAKFLNTLTYDQQNARTETTPNAVRQNFAMSNVAARYRNAIQIDTSGVSNTAPAFYSCNLDGYTTTGTPSSDATMNEVNDGMDLACNFLKWDDLVSYLDWAALRPMSDLEFEKICRGPVGRIVTEYVWGNASITQARSVWVNNAGQASETSTASGTGLCAYGWTSSAAVMRCGFAATATTNRVTAAATFYGALDMGGNVWERVVATNAAGATYTGTLGDGTLDATGDATNGDWPTGAGGGFGRRGGNFYDNYTYVRTSNRRYAYDGNASRSSTFGGRGVR